MSEMRVNIESANQEINARETVLRNLYQVIFNSVDEHPDNPQLILFIGIELGDVNIVRTCIENYQNLDANLGITGRNQHILEQFGCNFNSPRSVIH
jgi:hypothetical protein